jgi:hypothetical protein
MSDYAKIGEGIVSGFMILAVTCLVTLPLALWKAFELGRQLFSHLHWQ